MNDPLRLAETRLQRYWNVDGLHEIAVGLIFVLTALWIWATDIAVLPPAWKHALSASFPFLLWGVIFGAGFAVKRIRRNLTFPRVGFAEFRKPSGARRWVAAAVGAFIAALIAAASVRNRPVHIERWLTAIMGCALSLFLCQITARAQLPRFYLLAAVCAVAGVAISLAHTPPSLAMAIYFSILAAATLASGAVTLWRFLHAHPVER